ncbi:hypothetical protein JHK87_053588 [Glycine soja]|nr:hypothetical protein JHK87_053588 [Glycine soja]
MSKYAMDVTYLDSREDNASTAAAIFRRDLSLDKLGIGKRDIPCVDHDSTRAIPMSDMTLRVHYMWSFLFSYKYLVMFDLLVEELQVKGALTSSINSRVLVSTGSEDFVDTLVGLTPSVFVVHDSLLTLACIKEKYDRVKCWQGEIIYVPEKWAPFDAVFLYFLPALAFKLDQILGSLAGKCATGGRVIISHPKGREVLEQQRKQYPDVVVSDLPDKTYLQSVAAAHSFDVAEFVDEPGLYLAILICSRA